MVRSVVYWLLVSTSDIDETFGYLELGLWQNPQQ